MAEELLDGLFTAGIAACQIWDDFNAGQAIAVQRQFCALFLVKAKLENHGTKTAGGIARLLEGFDILFIQEDDFFQIRDCLVDVLDLIRHQFQSVGGNIVREQFSLPVVNQPACRNNRSWLDAVGIGTKLVFVML